MYYNEFGKLDGSDGNEINEVELTEEQEIALWNGVRYESDNMTLLPDGDSLLSEEEFKKVEETCIADELLYNEDFQESMGLIGYDIWELLSDCDEKALEMFGISEDEVDDFLEENDHDDLIKVLDENNVIHEDGTILIKDWVDDFEPGDYPFVIHISVECDEKPDDEWFEANITKNG